MLNMGTHLYYEITNSQWPIIYRKEYNVHFLGLEKLHPFDAKKWGNVFRYLKRAGLITEETIAKPKEATKSDLLIVHSKKYLRSLRCSLNVARIAEVPPLMIVPNYFVQIGYLRPMRYQTGGSILAGKLALDRGWAINIGGGFHHCSAGKGAGFCPYADITLLVQFLFKFETDRVHNVMIVDLDAHQGNGYERDFMHHPNVYILDMYNKGIYPHDKLVKPAIRKCVELDHMTGDEEYLTKLKIHLTKALVEFNADLIVYNAGTDILKGDRLGLLAVTADGIIKRDEIVFQYAKDRNIPVVMLTSGGYLKKTARIIATSIMNLNDLGLISGPLSRH